MGNMAAFIEYSCVGHVGDTTLGPYQISTSIIRTPSSPPCITQSKLWVFAFRGLSLTIGLTNLDEGDDFSHPK